MGTTTTEQIVREAPDIEAYKVGLLESAKKVAEAPKTLPAYSVAGFNTDQTDAFTQARKGIGAYQPYLSAGTGALEQGVQQTQQAANVLQQADTRNQYGAAQAATNLGLGAAGQLSATAGQINPALNAVDQAAAMAQNYQQANLNPAVNTIGAGINQLYAGTGQYDPNSVSAFMNPYQSQVIDQAMQEINRQAQIQGLQRNAQAVGAGAFGGSRQAIANAEANRNTQQLQNQTIANLMSQGYTQAQAQSQAAYEAGQQRDIAAGQALGQQGAQLGTLNLQQAGLGQQAAQNMGTLAGQRGQLASQQANIYNQQASAYGQLGQGIGTLAGQQFGVGQQIAQGLGQAGAQMGNLGVQQAALGQSAQTLGQNDVNMLYNIGQQQQALTQQQADAARNTQLQQIYQPYQDVAFMSDIYKGAPSSQQTIAASTAPVPSTFQQAAGLGIAGLSAGTAAKKAGLF